MRRADSAALLTASAARRGGALPPQGFQAWWEGRNRANDVEVVPIPFKEMEHWRFEEPSGNLVHDSGRFFSIEGLRVERGGGAATAHPIINQAEIGILGILVKEFDGVLHCLMQAKFEPGNVNLRQLSPTVQATWSNYTRVHGGGNTPYVEYFRQAGRDRILVDVLQSEQGGWFWRKRNRNMVVLVTEDIPVYEDYCWLTLGQVMDLMHVENLVNMDTRTIMACMPVDHPGDPDDAALARSYASGADEHGAALHPLGEIVSWFTDAKTRCDWKPRLVPLNGVEGWSRTGDEIADDGRRDFRIIAVRVGAATREVATWTQPLLATREIGQSAFLARPIGGVLHFLVQARPEPGLLDVLEIAPTVQLPPTTGALLASAGMPYVEQALGDRGGRVRFDAVLSEEGGRFHHAQTRYRIVEVGEEFPVRVPEDYCWMTAGQLMELLRHGHYLNIEARSLVTCIHSMR
ncbi:oxidase EvaA [Sinosporangium album]|uniref:Oxidase EvaA n=1 Tax=Sinosporangium album TaxID=504805 RepID=A0A1G8GI89_9ACTN|nr:NDP-hexose 2,3-dehydratase family protein [Sinosporangium album]SDH93987.1 oxidase EvaA [Sinosporangium album]